MTLSYNPTVANDGLVLYLDFANSNTYSGTGNTSYDLISGKSYTFINTPSFDSTGPKCVNLNGSTHHLSGNIDQLNFGTGDFTIQANIKLNGLSNGFTGAYNAAFVCAAAGSTGSCLIQVGGGSTSYTNIGIYHETTGNYNSINYNFSTNIIYNVALARSSGVLTAYVNGTAIGSTTTTNLYDFNKGGNFIGRHYFGGYEQYFKGNVYSLQAYSRGLSSTEILQNYNATKKRFLPEENIVTGGLVLYVDASKPNSYSGTGTSWYDLTGNGNDLRLTNGPIFTGINGGIFTFDGIDDNANRSYIWPSDFTFDIFCKPISSGGGFNRLIGTGDVFEFAIGNDSYVKYYYPGTWAGTGVTVTFGSYVQLCGVKSGSNFYLYKNGSLVSSGSITLTSVTSLYLSSRHNSSELVSSSISAFKIYNRALSATEIAQNYNAVKNRFGLS